MGVAVGVVSAGALDRLAEEMEEVRGEWVSREDEVREMCVTRQREVQQKT